MMSDELRSRLRESYDQKAQQRDGRTIQPWKLEVRSQYLHLLQNEQKGTILEIGAGTGQDSHYFQEHGFDVTCIDLSAEMVKMCRQKGLTAHVMDVANLDFPPGSFDAVFTLNCLLHLPKSEFYDTLQTVNDLLKPNGLFYLGIYGGYDHEGIWQDDFYEPKRFFSFRTDEDLLALVADVFEVVSFGQIPFDESNSGLHFQSSTLRKRQPTEP